VASTVGKLQSISDAALAHLEMDELLPEILRRASTVFRVDAAGLVLSDDEKADSSLVLCHGEQCSTESLARAAAERMFGSVLAGSALNVSDLSAKEAFGGLAARELRSLIAAPLSIGRSALGVLFLASSDAHCFSDEDMVVLRLSAERAAMAVEHARSYERERGLVESLQRHFLPDRLPQVPGLQMAARYQPSERAAQVGGDWYDVIALPDGRVGLAIGDVVGHGIGAATLMGELRAALRAYVVRDPGAPAKALASLNSLAAITHGGMVATLSYMVADVERQTILFASAGHPPPVLLAPDGSTTVLEHPPASPLGAADASEFSDWEGELPAGSTVVLYTDGLIERRGEPIDAGLARLQESLREAPEDLERLCSHLLARSLSAAGTLDDVALLAVRRAPASEQLDLELAAEPGSLTVARHRLERWLGDTGASEDDVFAIRLAVNEACTNAVEHAYGPERGPTYRLFAEHSAGEVLVQVDDSGCWRAPRGAHRGLGLQMIEQVMDELEIEQGAGGTTVRMRKRIGSA
jgi:serine phosphatase RsbU (regulator of sigma subunit)/anti-sigma regulatory factor (Ser/Thr protein kinase)